jgi:hypothetical protein
MKKIMIGILLLVLANYISNKKKLTEKSSKNL